MLNGYQCLAGIVDNFNCKSRVSISTANFRLPDGIGIVTRCCWIESYCGPYNRNKTGAINHTDYSCAEYITPWITIAIKLYQLIRDWRPISLCICDDFGWVVCRLFPSKRQTVWRSHNNCERSFSVQTPKAPLLYFAGVGPNHHWIECNCGPWNRNKTWVRAVNHTDFSCLVYLTPRLTVAINF